jgi:hypothetical protein
MRAAFLAIAPILFYIPLAHAQTDILIEIDRGRTEGIFSELPSPKGEGFNLRLKPVIVDLPVDCSQSQNRAQCFKLICEATKVKPFRLKAGGLRIPKSDSKPRSVQS